MGVPLFSSPAPLTKKDLQKLGVPGLSMVDYLKGNDATFDSGIGSWATVGGGSIAFDSSNGVDGDGCLAWTSSANCSVQQTLPGTFKAGHAYQALVAVKIPAGQISAPTYVFNLCVILGIYPTDYQGDSVLSFEEGGTSGAWRIETGDEYQWILVNWVPSADRTNVPIRIARWIGDNLDTVTAYVGAVRVVDLNGGPGLALSPVGGLRTPTDYSAGNIVPRMAQSNNGRQGFFSEPNRYTGGKASGPRIFLEGLAADMQGADDANGDAPEVRVSLYGAYIYSQQSVVSGRRGPGANGAVDFEVGPDYVGLQIIERSSSEVEISPDYNYDVILVDGYHDYDTEKWYTESADGTQKTPLSRLHSVKEPALLMACGATPGAGNTTIDWSSLASGWRTQDGTVVTGGGLTAALAALGLSTSDFKTFTVTESTVISVTVSARPVGGAAHSCNISYYGSTNGVAGWTSPSVGMRAGAEANEQATLTVTDHLKAGDTFEIDVSQTAAETDIAASSATLSIIRLGS